MRMRLLKLAAFLMLMAAPGLAQNWLEIKSKNFVVITDAGENRGREVAKRFEQMREVFGSLILRDKINATAPLTIFAFKDRKGLSQVAPLWKGKPVELAGVYYSGEDRHFIALDLSSSAGWSVVFHEYAHLLLNTNFPPAQLWFDEGFAEYYTTIDIGKKDVKIGMPIPNAAPSLSGTLMPVEKLFAITRTSPEYNESGDHRSLFYAESWLVVHYLYDLKRIRQTSKYFDLVLNQKVAIPAAIKQAYGVEAKEIDKELHGYMGSRDMSYITIQLPNVPEDVTYSARKMKDYELDLAIADLHLHSTDYFEKAGAEFQSVLKREPDLTDASRGLGYWYLHKDDLENAEKYFQRAADQGSTDARVHFFLAQAMFRRGENDPENLYQMSQSLAQALKYDPNYAEAYNLRGYLFTAMNDYPNAIASMKTAMKLDPRNEHFQLNLASAYLKGEKYDEAIALYDRLKDSSDPGAASFAAAQAASAREYKANPMLQLNARIQPQDRSKEFAESADKDELKAMEDRQRGIDEQKPDTRPVRYLTGKLTSVDCSHEPHAVLSVSDGKKVYRFTAVSVRKMLVIGANEFSCEWKDRKVSVNYHESAPLRGDVVSVEVY